MTSRASTLGTLLLVAILALTSACGGSKDKDAKDTQRSGPDRSNFVPITAKGVAAVVDKHLGKQVEGYAVLTDDPESKSGERTIEVTLRGADPQDSFTVSVFPEEAAQDDIVKGRCEDSDDGPDDPQEKVTCTPGPDGGNATITHYSFGLSGGPKGSYLTASGSGPESRQAFAQYDGFTKTIPVSDKDLQALMADPDLGWETDPKTNKAGESLKVGRDE